jgi:hypothetical protein
MKALLLAAALSLASHAALAIGPEEMEFIGPLTGKRQVTLTFLSDPDLYGSGGKALARCKTDYTRLDCVNARGGQPVSYAKGGKRSPYFRQARRLFSKINPGAKAKVWSEKGSYGDDCFVCRSGCSPSVPTFFILITHGD